jgi:G3E family GTPase
MRGILVRTNFVPGVRHVIGWRGLKESITSVEGWSAKIKDMTGVFGLYYIGADSYGEWLMGQFTLLYFPDPQEELVEFCSLKAGAYTQREDYLHHVRDFLRYPEVCELFFLGIIGLWINLQKDALILGLETMSHQRSVARDGVSVSQEGRIVELIKPGGYDQYFPSYFTAQAFFHVLAASFTFNLEEPPVYLRSYSRPGKEMVYDAKGNYLQEPSDDVNEVSLYLGYGQAGFSNILDNRKEQGARYDQDVTWKTGKAIIPEFRDAIWWHAHQISDYQTLDKKILGIDDRPQLIVLTGFLGSGKTSFLQHFIEYQVQMNRFVAVVQNEIGEIGLDGKLLDSDYAVTEIDEGCVCCTMVGNLKIAIHKILSNFHPDYIILETTGLANPYNLLHEIMEIEEMVRFDCVATIVDGTNVAALADQYDVVKDQVLAADILLVNKKDLLNEKKLQKIEQNLRKINPGAPIVSCRNGDINPSILFSADLHDHAEQKNLVSAKFRTGTIYSTHEHDGFSNIKVNLPRPMQKEHFIRLIDFVPDNVFRIKGIIDFIEHPVPLIFQYVAGRYDFSEFNNPGITDRFLVIIGQNLQQDEIRELFDQLNVSSDSV